MEKKEEEEKKKEKERKKGKGIGYSGWVASGLLSRLLRFKCSLCNVKRSCSSYSNSNSSRVKRSTKISHLGFSLIIDGVSAL